MSVHLTELEIKALAQFAADNPEIVRFVYGVSGLCTCDGYGVEMYQDGRFVGVMHPKSYLDLLREML